MVQINTVSKAEAVKQQSRQLRGNLARDLADTASLSTMQGYSLLKFHGVYQGYDRDSATERKQRGEDKLWQFMVRVRIPGGRLTADQYLALDALADRYADGSLRVTTRQSIQFHGIVKAGLKATIAEINAALLTTLAACGDVVRTVTTTPAPIRDAVHERLEADTRRLSSHLLPRTRAYHEIWVDGAPWQEDEGASEEPDPLYGERYLPRKFKIGLAIPEDNTIDVLTNDLAIVALFEGERLAGYNFLLGGGHGMTHNNPKTYPRLATPVAFVEPEDLLDAAAAVVRLHRDHGDRGNRRHARLKYVIAENGEDWARDRLSEYLGKPLGALPRLPRRLRCPIISAGTSKATASSISAFRCRVAASSTTPGRRLREIVSRFRCNPILMPSQDIILSDIRPEDRNAIEAMLHRHGVRQAAEMLPVERWALACPALPSCGLALTEAERVRDATVAAIEARLRRTGSSTSGSVSASPAARTAARALTPAISASSAGCPASTRFSSAAISRAPGSTSRSPTKCRCTASPMCWTRFLRYSRPPGTQAKGLAISATASACGPCRPPWPVTSRAPPSPAPSGLRRR